MDKGSREGEAVVLEPEQLRTLLRRSFDLGIDPDARKPRALNRLELAKALLGVAEANAAAAKSLAIEQGISMEEIVGSELVALRAAAFNGMPNAMFHLMERIVAIIGGLGALDPRTTTCCWTWLAARRPGSPACSGVRGMLVQRTV